MGTSLARLSSRDRILVGLAAAVVAVGALTAGIAIGGGGDDDGEVRTSGSTTTVASTSSSSSTSTSSTSTSSTVALDGEVTTTTRAPASSGGTTATTRKPGSGTTTPTTKPTTTTSGGSCNTSSSGNAGQVAAKFCAYRAANGLATMQRTSGMDAIAQEWADKLAADHNAHGQFALPHRTNDDLRGRVLATCSGCNGWAENLAYATDVDGIWNAWLNSSTHLANIRNGKAGVFGIGVAKSTDGYLFAVQNFGRYP